MEQLMEQGWRIAVIWECATREATVFDSVIKQLHAWVQTGKPQCFESEYRKL